MWFLGKIKIEEFGWNWLNLLKPLTCAMPKAQAQGKKKEKKRRRKGAVVWPSSGSPARSLLAAHRRTPAQRCIPPLYLSLHLGLVCFDQLPACPLPKRTASISALSSLVLFTIGPVLGLCSSSPDLQQSQPSPISLTTSLPLRVGLMNCCPALPPRTQFLSSPFLPPPVPGPTPPFSPFHPSSSFLFPHILVGLVSQPSSHLISLYYFSYFPLDQLLT